jgi:hypothetical protein
MNGHPRRIAVRNLVSPCALALISYAIFLFAWLFPPSLYSSYIGEPDLMFLDPTTLAFYTLCAAAFCLGVGSIKLLQRPLERAVGYSVSGCNALTFLTLPLMLAIGAGVIFLVLLGGNLNFVRLLMSNQGSSIKLALHSGAADEGGWMHAVIYLHGVLWWALYRAMQLQLKGPQRIGFLFVFGAGCFVELLICSATVSRGALIPLIVGLLTVYLTRTVRRQEMGLIRLAFVSVASLLLVVSFFALFSFLRGTLTSGLLVAEFTGYTISSYNRLAAILHGTLFYTYGGKGVYMIPILLENSNLLHFFKLPESQGWPSYFEVWSSEFTSVFLAGLNKRYIWGGVFGYLYSGIGWFTPLYLFVIGSMSGYVWAMFKRGRTLGIVLYPLFAYWILFWIGSNTIFNDHFFRILMAGVLLLAYDSLFGRPIEDGGARIPSQGLLTPAG